MESRNAPKPYTGRGPGLNKHNGQVRALAARIGGPEPQSVELGLETEAEEAALNFAIAQIESEQRGGAVARSLETDLRNAAKKTVPVVAHPKRGPSLHEDLELIFRVPAMQRFLAAWQAPFVGSRGPKARYAEAKALMAMMGMGRIGPHWDDNYAELESPAMVDLFASIDYTANHRALAEGISTAPWRPFDLSPCYSLSRLAEPLGQTIRRPALEASVAMMKVLRAMFPHAGIGERLLIDGTAVPAPCRQASSRGDKRLEEILRADCPDAGFRCVKYSPEGKVTIKDTDAPREGTVHPKIKMWRGYYYVVILDQATGLRLNSGLFDASLDEARAIEPLLRELHEVWPDIGAKTITGDAAWDEDWACELVQAYYGIKPIFRLHGPVTRKTPEPGDSVGGNVIGWEHDGRLICRHQKTLDFAKAQRPIRAALGLAPGQLAPIGDFRVRGTGCTTCGEIGLRMSADWSKLTPHPHHPYGKPEKYAERKVMLARERNQVEGHNNRLKGGHHLGGQAEYVHRIDDRATHESIFHLAELSMTACVVVDQLTQLGRPLPRLLPAPPASAAPKAARRRKNRITPVTSTDAAANAALVAAQTSEPDAEQSEPEPRRTDPFAALFGTRRGADALRQRERAEEKAAA